MMGWGCDFDITL